MLKDAILVTGPENKNTKAAPGVNPVLIKESAIGIEDVEHTYIGIPMTNIANNGIIVPLNCDNELVGIKVEINAAINKPIKKCFAISERKSAKA